MPGVDILKYGGVGHNDGGDGDAGGDDGGLGDGKCGDGNNAERLTTTNMERMME